MKRLYLSLLLCILAATGFSAKAARATVYIDNPSEVELWIYNSSTHDWRKVSLLTASNVPNSVEFNAETETEWDFDPIHSYIYRVTLNGEDVTNSEYTVSGVKNGDVIRVTVNAPTSQCSLHFAEGGEAISKVVVADVQTTVVDNTFSAKSGDLVLLYPSPDYTVSKVTVNDTEVNYIVASGCYAFTVRDPVTEIRVTAVNNNEIHKSITLMLDHADGVEVYMSSDPYSIGTLTKGYVDGSQTVDVSGTAPIIQFKAAEGYKITKATYTNTAGSSSSLFYEWTGKYYYVNVVTNDIKSIAITTEQENTNRINSVVYCNSVAPLKSYFIRTSDITFPFDSDNADALLHDGYQTLSIKESQNPLRINLEFTDVIMNYVYLNGSRLTSLNESSDDNSVWGNFTMPENGVLKIFTTGQPRTCIVTFDIQDLDTESVEVTADRITPVNTTRNYTCLEGTEMTVSEIDGYKVMLNDEDLIAADGVYTLTVNNGCKITVCPASAIETIGSDAANTNEEIYNLQGVRVSSSHLPSGIYIRGGKKIIVK